MKTDLPRRAPGRAEHDDVERPPSSGRGRLLVIEDDADDAYLVQDLLAEGSLRDFEVDWQPSVPGAVAALAARPYDACLLDFRLGRDLGLDVLAALEAIDPRPPVVVLTGETSREVDLAVMDAGASAFLNKSELTAARLERALRYAMREAAQRNTLGALANRDALTGLPNATAIAARVDEAVRRSRRTGRLVAVGLLELDRFAAVNDAEGLDPGDALRQAVGAALRGAARAHDLVGRLGGDRFVVVLEDVESEETARLAARRLHAAVGASIGAGCADRRSGGPSGPSGPAGTSASLGLALYPRHVTEAEALVPAAEDAVRAARRQGPGRVALAADRGGALEATPSAFDLRAAIGRGELSLALQPKVDLATGDLVGVEALARWDRVDGPVSPNDFVPVLERSGDIGQLDLWILEQALAWRAACPTRAGLGLAVNLSPVDLASPEFVEQFAAHLHDDPGRVEVELTENALLPQGGDPGRVLKRLSALGVSLALDDFGTGFSSFSRLRDLPVDTVKIDRSFVAQMLSSDRDAAIVEGMISLATTLGLTVVAEGVEAPEQADRLAALGVGLGQGFWFGRPMAPDAFDAWAAGRPAGSD